MVELLKANNPNCFLVTGRPLTPCDQGSVENANKLVQRVLKSISADRRLKGLEVNWTNLLGQIMAVCNSQTGMKSLNTLSMMLMKVRVTSTTTPFLIVNKRTR